MRVQLWTPERVTEEEQQLLARLAEIQPGIPAGRTRQGILGEDEGSARRVSDSAPWVNASRLVRAANAMR